MDCTHHLSSPNMFSEGQRESYRGVGFRNTDSAEEDIGTEDLLVTRDQVA